MSTKAENNKSFDILHIKWTDILDIFEMLRLSDSGLFQFYFIVFSIIPNFIFAYFGHLFDFGFVFDKIKSEFNLNN